MAQPAEVVPIQAGEIYRRATAEEERQDAKIWDDPSRRQLKDNENVGRSLLRRLGVSAKDMAVLVQNERFMRAVGLWAMEVPMNIAWYEKAIPKERRFFTVSRVLSVVLGIGTIVATTMLVFMNRTLATAQLGVVAAGAFGVLQLLAAGSDPKTRLGGFQKARADLREAMFTFQQNWQGRPLLLETGDSKLPLPAPDFMTALYQEIRTGRKIARDERDTYFGTFKSATEILSVANAGLDAVRGRRTEVSAAFKDTSAAEITHDAAVATRIQELRDKLSDATALKEALEDKKRRLTARHVEQKQIDDVDAKIDETETDRFKTQRLLDLAVKGDVAHPM